MTPGVFDPEPPSAIPSVPTPVIKVDEVKPEPPVNNENEHRQRDHQPPSGTLPPSGTPSSGVPFTPQHREQSHVPMVSNINNVQQQQHQSPKKSVKTGSFNAVKKQQQTESVWDHEERRKVETRNNNMRQTIYKEVKKPGRNYDRLLELLKELHGPADMRQQYILMQSKRPLGLSEIIWHKLFYKICLA